MRWRRGAAKPLRTDEVAVRPLARGQGRERGLNALHRPENHGQRPVPPHRGNQHTEWHNEAGEDPGNDRQAFAPGSRILPGAPCQTIKATDRAATRRHGACHLSAAGRRDGRAASDLPADGGDLPGAAPGATPSAPSDLRRPPSANPGAAPRCHHGSVHRTPPMTIKKRTAAGPLFDGGGGGSHQRTALSFHKAEFPATQGKYREFRRCDRPFGRAGRKNLSEFNARRRIGANIQTGNTRQVSGNGSAGSPNRKVFCSGWNFREPQA